MSRRLTFRLLALALCFASLAASVYANGWRRCRLVCTCAACVEAKQSKASYPFCPRQEVGSYPDPAGSTVHIWAVQYEITMGGTTYCAPGSIYTSDTLTASTDPCPGCASSRNGGPPLDVPDEIRRKGQKELFDPEAPGGFKTPKSIPYARVKFRDGATERYLYLFYSKVELPDGKPLLAFYGYEGKPCNDARPINRNQITGLMASNLRTKVVKVQDSSITFSVSLKDPFYGVVEP